MRIKRQVVVRGKVVLDFYFTTHHYLAFDPHSPFLYFLNFVKL